MTQGWWSYAKFAVRRYPALCRELEELRSGGGERPERKPSGGRGQYRPTETLALRELPGAKQQQYDAVRAALDWQDLRTMPELRRELVRLVYWERSHTLTGAAMRLHISYDTARTWNRDFIWHVGRALGVTD